MSWAEESGVADFNEDLLQTISYEKIVTETEKAILLQDNKGLFWLQLSVITEHYENEKYFVYLALDNLTLSYQKQYVNIITGTDKAILFEDEIGRFWIAKSVISYHDLAKKRFYYLYNSKITLRYLVEKE